MHAPRLAALVLLALLLGLGTASALPPTSGSPPQEAVTTRQDNSTGGPRFLAVDARVRALPSLTARGVALLARGTRVELLSCTGDWCLISFAGRDGNRIGYLLRVRLRR